MRVYAKRNSNSKNQNSKADYNKSSDLSDTEVGDVGSDSNKYGELIDKVDKRYQVDRITQLQSMADEYISQRQKKVRQNESKSIINRSVIQLEEWEEYQTPDLRYKEVEKLIQGWKQAQDSTGKKYYYNKGSGETQWDNPGTEKMYIGPEGDIKNERPLRTYYSNGITTQWLRPDEFSENSVLNNQVSETPSSNESLEGNNEAINESNINDSVIISSTENSYGDETNLVVRETVDSDHDLTNESSETSQVSSESNYDKVAEFSYYKDGNANNWAEFSYQEISDTLDNDLESLKETPWSDLLKSAEEWSEYILSCQSFLTQSKLDFTDDYLDSVSIVEHSQNVIKQISEFISEAKLGESGSVTTGEDLANAKKTELQALAMRITVQNSLKMMSEGVQSFDLQKIHNEVMKDRIKKDIYPEFVPGNFSSTMSDKSLELRETGVERNGEAVCNSFAAAVASKLSGQKSVRVEIVGSNATGHNYVVVGRNLESNLRDYKTWGENSVIIDAWNGAIYWNGFEEYPKVIYSLQEHIGGDGHQPSDIWYDNMKDKSD